MTATHEIITLPNGSRAVRDRTNNEIMHPGVGPIAEARDLYVAQSGLAARLHAAGGTRVLFDVGLGAATNATFARNVAEAAPATDARLAIVSFERDFGPLAVALSEPESFALTGDAGAAARALLDRGEVSTARTDWYLRRGDVIAALEHEPLRADFVFWDMYSYYANPELWTPEIFALLASRCNPGATLVTYSASKTARASLTQAGWTVRAGAPMASKQVTVAALQ